MKIIYKEAVIIDDKEYAIFTRNYSPKILNLIDQGLLGHDPKSIIYHIADDIANSD
jgi:hypothetical protein